MGLWNLTQDEIKSLGLERKIQVQWWSPDNTPLLGKTSFYYVFESKLREVKGLALAYPACLIVRETIIKSERKITKVRIKGLPHEDTAKIGNMGKFDEINFSHYHIGRVYGQSIRWDIESEAMPWPIEIVSEVAPITFLNKLRE